MGLTFRYERESRVQQESDVRADGAEHIIHVGQQCQSWRDVARLVREADVIRIPWLALVPTDRGKDKTAPSGQPAEFILEVHERGGIVIECRTGRRSDNSKQRQAMIADAVRAVRQGGRKAPASGKPAGRPANTFTVEALAHNEGVWKSQDYSTNEIAERHFLEGMEVWQARRLWGPSGRPWPARRRKRQ